MRVFQCESNKLSETKIMDTVAAAAAAGPDAAVSWLAIPILRSLRIHGPINVVIACLNIRTNIKTQNFRPMLWLNVKHLLTTKQLIPKTVFKKST